MRSTWELACRRSRAKPVPCKPCLLDQQRLHLPIPPLARMFQRGDPILVCGAAVRRSGLRFCAACPGLIAGKPAPTGTAQGLNAMWSMWELACRRSRAKPVPCKPCLSGQQCLHLPIPSLARMLQRGDLILVRGAAVEEVVSGSMLPVLVSSPASQLLQVLHKA